MNGIIYQIGRLQNEIVQVKVIFFYKNAFDNVCCMFNFKNLVVLRFSLEDYWR